MHGVVLFMYVCSACAMNKLVFCFNWTSQQTGVKSIIIESTCMYTQFSPHHYSHTLTPSQSVLSAKQRELDECVGRVRELEGLLRVAQRQSDKAAMLNMKKV